MPEVNTALCFWPSCTRKIFRDGQCEFHITANESTIMMNVSIPPAGNDPFHALLQILSDPETFRARVAQLKEQMDDLKGCRAYRQGISRTPCRRYGRFTPRTDND